jgi:hypothetical protein
VYNLDVNLFFPVLNFFSCNIVDPKKSKIMALKVIGAGLPRTGSASLKTALETLGYGECMHMETLFNNPQRVDYWVELFKTGTTDFDALFDGFQSTSDFPGALLYKELLAQYPDAKVVLGLRDPEEWYESASRTVYAFTPKTLPQKLKLLPKKLKSQRFRNIAKTLRMVEVFLWKKFFNGEFPDKAKTIERFNQFADEVRAHVPAEQLLEYRISDGWEPLCEFLEVPVPTEPIPHRNQRDKFIAQLSKMMSRLPVFSSTSTSLVMAEYISSPRSLPYCHTCRIVPFSSSMAYSTALE